MFDWNNKNVVYVGGFTGVGFQMCRLLMQKKLKMLVIVHRMENVEMMKKLQADNMNVKVMFLQMNIMDRNMMEQNMKQLPNMLGGHIDVLINGMEVLADKDVETTIGVNLSGLIHMTMLAMPYMDKTQMGQGGMVVNIASVYGLEPAPAFAVYGAAKHGVIGFTRSMADKNIYQKTGVMFMAMCPGLTKTEMMMNLRDNTTWMHSEEVAEAIESAKHQSAEEAAMQMMKAIEMMKNGSIWIVNHGQLKEILPTMHWHM